MKAAALIALLSLPSIAQTPQQAEPDANASDAESLAIMNKKLDKLIKEKEEKERAAIQKRDALIGKQPAKFRKLILKGEICLGMNPVQVGLALGKPGHVNRTTHRGGVHEQWVYSNGFYVYFENGLVTAIQD